MSKINSLGLVKELNEQQIKILVKRTDFDQNKILQCHAKFVAEAEDGKLNMAKFQKICGEIFPNKGNPQEFYKLAFKAFDKNESGSIDFDEFVTLFPILSRGNVIDRLELMFSLYDQDSSGYIDGEEFENALRAVYKMVGLDDDEVENSMTKILEMMKKIDSNSDNKVSKMEFVEACLSDPSIKNLLGTDAN